jgi:hypothetical protein
VDNGDGIVLAPPAEDSVGGTRDTENAQQGVTIGQTV